MDRVELAKALREVALRGLGNLPAWGEMSQASQDDYLREADKAIELLSPNDDLRVHRLNLEELVQEMGVVPGDEDTLADLLEHIRTAARNLRIGHHEWAGKWRIESRKAVLWRQSFKKLLEISHTLGELDQ